MSAKVEGWVVAQRRPWAGENNFIFHSDWASFCGTREEADDTAKAWRHSQQSDDPTNVGIFALVRVDAPTEVHVDRADFMATVLHEHPHGTGPIPYLTRDAVGDHYTTDRGVHLVCDLPEKASA